MEVSKQPHGREQGENPWTTEKTQSATDIITRFWTVFKREGKLQGCTIWSFASSYTGEGFWVGLVPYLIKGIIIPPVSLRMSSAELDFILTWWYGGAGEVGGGLLDRWLTGLTGLTLEGRDNSTWCRPLKSRLECHAFTQGQKQILCFWPGGLRNGKGDVYLSNFTREMRDVAQRWPKGRSSPTIFHYYNIFSQELRP